MYFNPVQTCSATSAPSLSPWAFPSAGDFNVHVLFCFSHKAFTVIPPNPKKRKEMQRSELCCYCGWLHVVVLTLLFSHVGVCCFVTGWAEAEAELAALEELRLSRAMAYVSINPSSVGETHTYTHEKIICIDVYLICVRVCVLTGGCMSLEEVRLKQQQEMMEAKRKQKPVWKEIERLYINITGVFTQYSFLDGRTWSGVFCYFRWADRWWSTHLSWWAERHVSPHLCWQLHASVHLQLQSNPIFR